jgi:hypothetical protein
LRFAESRKYNNDDKCGSISYNYQVTKKDTFRCIYRFTAYHFTGDRQAINDHVFNVAYGRKITGRLGLSLFASEIVTFRVQSAPKLSKQTCRSEHPFPMDLMGRRHSGITTGQMAAAVY